MKLKKILPLALALSLMVGCSGKKQSSTPTNEEIVTEDEIMTIVEEAEEDGTLNTEETKLIRSVIEFDDLEVGDILVPRVNIVAVDVDSSMEEIRARMIEYYPEIATLKVDKIREYCNVDDGTFITCQRSVPEAIVCFLESTSFEDAVRNAVSLGGDADTQGAITGSIAEAYWGVPIELEDKALTYLLPKLETIYYAFNTIKGKRVKR